MNLVNAFFNISGLLAKSAINSKHSGPHLSNTSAASNAILGDIILPDFANSSKTYVNIGLTVPLTEFNKFE